MSISHQSPVVLAVDEGPAATAALDFAINEARRAQTELHLLHVVHAHPTNTQELMVGREFTGPAERMLAELAKQAEDRTTGDLVVTTEVARGPVVGTIVARSHDARMVVLQGEETGRLVRIVTGQVRNGVASRATVPVVCVPPGWTAPDEHAESIVVGIDDPYHAEGMIRAALDATAGRGCPIRFLNTWWFSEPYDDVVFTRRRIREWTEDTEHALGRIVEKVTPEYGDLQTEVEARHERPADALVEESSRASLLVIGRRDPRLPLGSHIGPVARAVLRRSVCPVMVVESASEDRT
jgi:nucleotide-binding universal stress UspA family protein